MTCRKCSAKLPEDAVFCHLCGIRQERPASRTRTRPNGMGTGLLARRVEPALLEARDNLPAQYVIVAARQGIGNMPPIPRGEVSDADLQAIADYLAAGPHPSASGGAQ